MKQNYGKSAGWTLAFIGATSYGKITTCYVVTLFSLFYIIMPLWRMWHKKKLGL